MSSKLHQIFLLHCAYNHACLAEGCMYDRCAAGSGFLRKSQQTKIIQKEQIAGKELQQGEENSSYTWFIFAKTR